MFSTIKRWWNKVIYEEYELTVWFKDQEQIIEGRKVHPHTMKMLLTRIGEGSKIVVTGDLNQHERGYENNGLKCFMERLRTSQSDRVKMVHFNNKDIERHPAVAEVSRLYNEV